MLTHSSMLGLAAISFSKPSAMVMPRVPACCFSDPKNLWVLLHQLAAPSF